MSLIYSLEACTLLIKAMKYRDQFGHTHLSTEEEIPWKCRTLVIGTGTGALPNMEEVRQEAKRPHQTARPADRQGN